MKTKSFAKVNLGLEVLKKREDDYHEIRTLFQTIDLFDVLEFRTVATNTIRLLGNDETVPWNEDNLIFKAVQLLQDRFNLSQGIEVRVTKNIPPGRGLGGGSSNAALALYALNKIWSLNLSKKGLMELGKTIGADVPYFLEGGLCLGAERGDKITPLGDLAPLSCLLVLPSFSISTSSVYGDFEFTLTSRDKDSKIIKFLTDRNICFLENRLEETIFSPYPQLRDIKNLFQRLGSELSLVSGTGSAVFGLFSDRDKAKRGLRELKEKYPSLLVETLSRESYWNKVGV
jgi:4-diphosphocytidyl-2-C-methyl-D-erythritol kinase